MVTLLTRAFTEDEARAVAGWSYPAPLDLYNVDPDNWRLFLDRTTDGEGYYPALDDSGAVVAFCSASRRGRGSSGARIRSNVQASRRPSGGRPRRRRVEVQMCRNSSDALVGRP